MTSILILGAGAMGRKHFLNYQNMENVDLIGVMDISYPSWLKEEINNIQYFSSFEKAFENHKQIDVVDICLPTYLHKDYVKKCAEHGKHIICEKPLANTLRDGREMINICKKNNVKLFVGHVVRFFPEYQKAKKIVDSGKIGTPSIIRTTRNSPFPTAWNNWYSDHKNSGGLILDLLIHDFDYLRWCFGDVEWVNTRELTEKDYALVTLRFKNGVIAHVEGSWSHKNFFTKFEIRGNKGLIEFDSSTNNSLNMSCINNEEIESVIKIPGSHLNQSPYLRELAHFIDCIENEQTPIVTSHDAYEAIRISLAALESVITKKPIKLKSFGMKEGDVN